MGEVVLTWDGSDAGRLGHPPVAETERRVDGLNGADRTLVTIERISGYLAAGGSATEGMVVYTET